MWRAIFLALGLTLCLWGLECLVVERAVLTSSASASNGPATDLALVGVSPPREPRTIEPPEWAPWSLLSAGGIVVLYSLMLKSGSGGNGA